VVITPDCGRRGLRIEPALQTVSVCVFFSRKLLRYAALVTGCTLIAVPRSTQPSTLRGTVNEYQPYGRVLIQMAMGKCSAYCSITSDSKAKFAAWLQSWRPPGADQLAPRRPEPEDPLCAGDDIVLCIIFVIFDHGKPLVLKNYKSYKDMFGSAPYSGRSSSIKLSCSKTELSRCTTTAIRYHYYPYTPTKDLLHTIVLHISNR